MSLTAVTAFTAKVLTQDYRYFKFFKAFSKFCRRHSALVEKYNVGLKTLLQQGILEPEFYDDLVYRFSSKAVVPLLVLLFVALWFILRGDLLYVFPCVILFLCFSVLLVLRLPRLGKRELILVLFVRLFGLCLFRFVGFLFLLGSGKGCGFWLWHSLDVSLTIFRNILGKSNFSEQSRTLINHYKRIGYSLDIMRQTACLLINPIIVDGYGSFFNYTWRLGPQTQWRPLRKSLTSGLGIDDMSLAWPPVVVQLLVSFTGTQ